MDEILKEALKEFEAKVKVLEAEVSKKFGEKFKKKFDTRLKKAINKLGLKLGATRCKFFRCNGSAWLQFFKGRGEVYCFSAYEDETYIIGEEENEFQTPKLIYSFLAFASDSQHCSYYANYGDSPMMYVDLEEFSLDITK
jgi:hypothetical protein